MAYVERAIRTLKHRIHTLIKNATRSTEAADEYVDWWKYLPRALKSHNVEKLSTVTKYTPQELHDKFDSGNADEIEKLRQVVRTRLEKVSSNNQKYAPIKVGDLVKVRAKHSPTDNIQKIEFKRNVYTVKYIDHTGMGALYTLGLAEGYPHVENYTQVIGDEANPHQFLRHELLKITASETPIIAIKPFSELEKALREKLHDKAMELVRILETKGNEMFQMSLNSTPLRTFFQSVKDEIKEKNIVRSKILRMSDFLRLFRDKFKLYRDNQTVGWTLAD